LSSSHSSYVSEYVFFSFPVSFHEELTFDQERLLNFCFHFDLIKGLTDL